MYRLQSKSTRKLTKIPDCHTYSLLSLSLTGLIRSPCSIEESTLFTLETVTNSQPNLASTYQAPTSLPALSSETRICRNNHHTLRSNDDRSAPASTVSLNPIARVQNLYPALRLTLAQRQRNFSQSRYVTTNCRSRKMRITFNWLFTADYKISLYFLTCLIYVCCNKVAISLVSIT